MSAVDIAARTPTVQLRNGSKMPALGLGTFLSGPNEVYEAVLAALRCGYRHIDCAWFYGNEREVGDALKKGMEELGLKRDDIFITSKLWMAYYEPERVEPILRDSLEKLQLEYLDLYLMHWPLTLRYPCVAIPPPKEDILKPIPTEVTWAALEACLDKGLIKEIGVSNFSIPKLEKFLVTSPRILPSVNQVEMHPLLSQKKLKKFCEGRGIKLTGYAPLGCPGRSVEGCPPLMEDPLLLEMSKSLGLSPAAILVGWAMKRGTVSIPKSVKPQRIQQNLEEAVEAFEKLTDEMMHQIDNLESTRGRSRYYSGVVFTGGEGLQSVAQIWDEEEEERWEEGAAKEHGA